MNRLFICCTVIFCILTVILFPGCGNKTVKYNDYSLPEVQKPLPEPPEAMLANSDTYTSEKYGFSFNYTDDFKPAEDEMDKLVILYGPMLEDFIYTIHIFMMKEDSDGRFTLADYAGIGRESAALNLKDFVLLDEYVTTVVGVPAVVQVDKYTHTIKDENIELQEMIVSFMIGDTFYALKYSCSTEFYDEYVDAFYLVLNTLAFSGN